MAYAPTRLSSTSPAHALRHGTRLLQEAGERNNARQTASRTGELRSRCSSAQPAPTWFHRQQPGDLGRPAVRNPLLRQRAESLCSARSFYTAPARNLPSAAPKSRDRGPPSKEETQTDFTAMDILSSTPVPTTAIDACMYNGFALNSGLKVTGSGVLLLGGEALKWRPWIREGDGAEGVNRSKLTNVKGQLELNKSAWGVLSLVWPKPDLLILGTGKSIVPLSPQTRKEINELGIRIEVQDTRNAAAQFNLLATERGVQQVAAALVPIGWQER